MGNKLNYLINIGHLHDSEMEDFARLNNITTDQLISDMVEAGWSQGMDINHQHEYWEKY